MQILAAVALLTLTLDIVNPDVQMPEQRAGVSNKQRSLESHCNSVTYDRVLLKRLTLLSKYIFTGKVYGVRSCRNTTRIYKVNIRRVLKGDLNDIGVAVKFGTAKALRFSDATVLVESSHSAKCPPLRMRTYAIFLTEKKHGEGGLWLSLVIEPVLLTLRSIQIIEAAVKGEEKEERQTACFFGLSLRGTIYK